MSRTSQTIHARLLCGAAAIAFMGVAGAASAEEARFNIPPQPLSVALKAFSEQSGRPVLYRPEIAAAKVSGGATGSVDVETALNQILSGSNLAWRREGETFLIVQAGEGGSSPQSASAGGDVEALIVTAQKKEEAIQDVPIAISAFSQKSLDAQKLEGGFDLLKAIPNVTFSKNNFSGYNFSIRGVGTKAISATTDPGVAVSFNNTTLIVNRLFEQEYFDVERVEVLRGPQGTLYGRNATSGVINVLSARPRLGQFEGEIKLEGGNYNAQRVRGMVNLPVGDTLAVRLAGAMTKRDGYGINEAAANPLADVSEDVDDRDLWSARVTVGWEPMEGVRVNALWERFEENDSRARTSKQLCHNDPGPRMVGAFDWEDHPDDVLFRGLTSQGCVAGSLYEDSAFGTPNGASLPYVNGLYIAPLYGAYFRDYYGLGFSRYKFDEFTGGPSPRCAALIAPINQFATFPLDLCQPDPYGGQMQSRDLRTIHSLLQPVYRADADIFELSVDIDLSEGLTFTSQTVFNRDEYYASQDFNRFTTFPIFEDSSLACNPDAVLSTFTCDPGGYAVRANLTPGGVYTDPQLGPSNSMVGQDLSRATSEQFNQEFRLVSNFDADLNFSLGANFTRFETRNDYFVFINALSLLTNFYPFGDPTSACALEGLRCVYVDPNPLESINGDGHNYFRSANPYELTSSALFGELYWQATDTVKVTVGARMTWDHKVFSPVPSQLLLYDYRELPGYVTGDGPGDVCPPDLASGSPIAPFCAIAGNAPGGRGFPANADIRQEWREPTGRIIVDWKPDLAFTDESMLYASLSHGYKGGGANPPGIATPAGFYNARNSGGAAPPTFEPEFVNAFELGTKNTLLGGALILNGSAFFYDYQGYQVSKILDRSASNENFDARIWGAELEWIFSPTRTIRFNGTFGALRTEVADGEQSIDLMDRAQGGNQSWTAADGHVYDEWVVLKPWITNASNCIAPLEAVEAILLAYDADPVNNFPMYTTRLCPGGDLALGDYRTDPLPGLGRPYNPDTDAPNRGAGFYADLSGRELPNAPHWTASMGAQYRFGLPGGWDGTARADFYWQSQSFARVYNTQYDKLRAWTNTNFSVWVENPDWGVKAEVYVKNAFDEIPITDAFLGSDDTGLTTNVFTLDPRLIGVSVTKSF